ncbi:hypothetical protein E1B28_001295 [Marasmius oreades]|uniref:Uncharacterized protein n=1 Tax=Marasmius oreades TaxID=181124 RepID=A0A9P7V328_9AGAR|nr:uncharacterized protein E1B28_001295 [Marasmius oreades]KAG7099444.1 hypothetical protein E1B28_001295 [Marasmius oreades]
MLSATSIKKLSCTCIPHLRCYATVSSFLVNNSIGKPPVPPSSTNPSHTLSQLDQTVLASLQRTAHRPRYSLFDLIGQYINNSGRILDVSLPYESRPVSRRKVALEENDNDIVLVTNCIRDEDTGEHKITVSSGFVLEVPTLPGSMVVTCAHTLEEIRRTPLALKHLREPSLRSVLSGMFVVTGTSSPIFHTVSSVSSTLPRSDILLLTCDKLPVRTLPVSPYPAPPQTTIHVHLAVHDLPHGEYSQSDEWRPGVGGTWRRWGRGEVKGYRDLAGRETKPGTYDSLSHMLFAPLPTPGSSGGPIVDEESGAVVGISLGSRMDNRIEGIRGWGVPSEAIYEMFSLPGLEGKM